MTRCAHSLSLAALLLLPAAALAQSPGPKNAVVNKLKTIDAEVQKAVAKFEADDAAGKLAQGRSRRMALASFGRILFGLSDAYDKALANGWPADDPDLAPVPAKLRELKASFEERGFWTCWAPGEPALKERATLDKYLDTIHDALDSAEAGDMGKVQSRLESFDASVAKLEEQDAARGGGALAAHPAFARFKAKAAQLRASADSRLAAGQNAQRLAEIDFKEIRQVHARVTEIGGFQLLELHRTGALVAAFQRDEAGTMAKLDAVETEIPALEAYLGEFGRKYGTTRRDIQMSVRKIEEAAGAGGWGRGGAAGGGKPVLTPDGAYVALEELTRTYPEMRKSMASRLLTLIDRRIEAIVSFQFKDTSLERALDDVEQRLAGAAKADPQNAEIQARIKQMGPTREKVKAEIERRLDAARFPADKGDYAGPGTLAEVKAQIMEWAKTAPQFAEVRKAVVVSIQGNWETYSTDALGQTTQWGLPVMIATVIASQGPDVVTVWEGHVLTFEASGVQKGPPLWGFGFTVRGDYRMRTKNLPR